MSDTLTAAPPRIEGKRYRWLVLAVLTAVHSTHHIDRNVLSVVVEPIRQ